MFAFVISFSPSPFLSFSLASFFSSKESYPCVEGEEREQRGGLRCFRQVREASHGETGIGIRVRRIIIQAHYTKTTKVKKENEKMTPFKLSFFVWHSCERNKRYGSMSLSPLCSLYPITCICFVYLRAAAKADGEVRRIESPQHPTRDVIAFYIIPVPPFPPKKGGGNVSIASLAVSRGREREREWCGSRGRRTGKKRK